MPLELLFIGAFMKATTKGDAFFISGFPSLDVAARSHEILS